MKHRLKKHFWYYLSLTIILTLGLVLIVLTAYDKQLQMMVIVMTTIIYVAWSLLHHYLHHSLTVKIVIEYILIASLGLTLSLFLFNI